MSRLDKAAAVIHACRTANVRLGVAESCTGGLLAAALTDVAGASDVFWGGLVTYANEAKQTLLGVNSESLQAHGAVSEETAQHMAEGICQKYLLDLAVSITGIAGPGGGTANKPVGLVHFACYFKGSTTHNKKIFTGNRATVRSQAVEHALDMLLNAMRV